MNSIEDLLISRFVPPDHDEGEAGVDNLLQLVEVDRGVKVAQMVVLPQTVFKTSPQ